MTTGRKKKAGANYEKGIVSCRMSGVQLTVGANAAEDSPGYGVLLPADKRAPQGAVVELGGAGALPGADAGTTAGSLPA